MGGLSRADRDHSDGIPFTVEVFDRDRAVQFVDYHWNLSTMLKQSRKAGFRLLAVTELPDATGGNARDKDR